MSIDTIIKKIENHERIDSKEALDLYRNADLLTLGSLANQKRFYLHPERRVTYVVDRNINYTNICVSGCRFCAFYQPLEKGYILSKRELSDKIQETIDLGGTQILLQGGMHPDLEIDFYVDMLSFIKSKFDIHIHGFSPPEIDFIAKKSNLSVAQTIAILKEAGLASIPGGGAEILDDDIRQKVSPNKCLSEEWLEVMRQAHLVGMRSSATMMFGHLEQDFHIIAHLEKIRSLQEDRKSVV